MATGICMGATRRAELDRSAKLFQEIVKEQGLALALYFLLDSGYGREEIKEIAERLRTDIDHKRKG